ncbi:response regulator transcription factor [Streptomyces sp. SID8111]|uniref:response regulator transcription factor n=1 Tax=Streptomyces sp. SID8111 TaxID=2706100 RepID=UPI0013C264B9|nr:DNA-binding response regulator [Streptomyces sp. SID8111]NEC31444.1 response regulator transcription factor [Streptomyces sp. SID8111]
MTGITITVGAVDDDRMLLDGLRLWLADVPGIHLAATAPTVGELLTPAPAPARTPAPATHAEPPCLDVVLLDLLLRDGSSPSDNIRRLRAAGPRVLVISTVADRGRIVAAMAAGADGYLTKDHDLPTLVTALTDIAAGGTAHCPELAFAWAHDDTPARPALSPKERQVLVEYASGLTLKATARRLGISPHTAKYYLDRVKDKYQQAGRPTYTKTDLACRVREDGWAPD